jgi:hypothetical protein
MSSYFKNLYSNPKEEENLENFSSYYSANKKSTDKDIQEENLKNDLDSNDESLGSKIIRNTARLGTDVAQTVVASPGENLAFANLAAGPIYEGISGKKSSPYEEMGISKILPTNEQLQKNRPDYLLPKNETEAFFSDSVKNITNLLNPIDWAGKYKFAKKGVNLAAQLGKKLFKATALESGGELVKQGAEKLGVDQETSKYLKFGSVVLSSILSEGGLNAAKKLSNSLYDQARKLRSPSSFVNANKLKTKLVNLKKSLESGGVSPASSSSLKKVDEMLENINKGQGRISIEDLENFKKKINIDRGNLYQELPGRSNKAGRKTLKSNIDSVSSIVDEGLDEYGKLNPKWYKKYKEANEVFSSIESSKTISRNLGHLAKKYSPHSLSGVILAGATNPEMIIPTGIGSIATFAGLKVAELGARFMKSPSLRKHYMNILEGAATGNSQFVVYNLNLLKKAIEDDPSLLEEKNDANPH